MTCHRCGSDLPLAGSICPYCWAKRPEGSCLLGVLVLGLVLYGGCYVWRGGQKYQAEQQQQAERSARADQLRAELTGKDRAAVVARLGEPEWVMELRDGGGGHALNYPTVEVTLDKNGRVTSVQAKQPPPGR